MVLYPVHEGALFKSGPELGGQTFRDKKEEKGKIKRKRKMKEEDNWHKIKFLLPILCIKELFFSLN